MISEADYIPSLTERADYYDLPGASEQGRFLPAVSAASLEDALLLNSEDLVSRARLLGHYRHKQRFARGRETSRIADLRMSHIMWFIANAPDCKFAGDAYLAMDRRKNPHHYKLIKKAWLERIGRNPRLSMVAINAAMFMFEQEPKASAEELRKVQCNEPSNLWASRLLSALGIARIEPLEMLTMPSIHLTREELKHWQDFSKRERTYLDRVLHHGMRMPPISVKTLEYVLAKYPNDACARAELIGFYQSRWRRTNVLGFDPEYLSNLIGHVLWCIVHIPGCAFTALNTGINNGVPPLEHALLAQAWSEQVLAHSKNASVMAAAAIFFHRSGQHGQARELLEKAKSFKRKDPIAEYILKYGVRSSRRRRTNDSLNATNLLETIAIDMGASRKRLPALGKYTAAEWVSELDLGGAHLEGVYNWVGASSIAALEDIMHEDSFDAYNRAKIIGAYDGNFARLTNIQKKSHLTHMSWFIEHAPQCRFFGTFRLTEQDDSDSYNSLKKLIRKKLRETENCLDTKINGAIFFLKSNQAECARLGESVLKENKAWGERIMLLMRESIPEVDIESVLRLSRFMPKQWNRNFSRIAKKIDLVHLASSARCCPRRTQWSSERALERNPNDLVLRAELTWSYDRIDQFSVYFDGHTPDVLPSLVRHNLWFIQNTPDVYLYSLGCHLEAVGGLKHLDDGLGDHAVLLEAAKRQISAYPTNLKVALALRHYFPLSGRGSRAQEAIAALQKVARIYPNNKELKNCLEHLSKFVGDEQENRRRRLKQARKARL